jgi:threonine dehydrogenase-like Zn-dependent dehydrogenase
MEKGDILGHEFCGIIDQVGSAITNHKVGDRVVASFQIACGDVRILDRSYTIPC